jgi:glucose-6-phosphate dehydrogenase assembly protein OpcA
MRVIRKLGALAGTAAAARAYVRKNPDKVNRAATKAGEFIDKRTKGKYHGKIDNVVTKVHHATTPKHR